MAKSNVSVDMGLKNDFIAKLENIRIKDREMIPEWNIFTRKSTETIYSPEADENDKRRVLGISTTVETSSVITIRPEEFYKNKDDSNAESNGKETKTAG
jgi:hypothetical protein